MSEKTQSELGKDILSYCGKCKMPMGHIIVKVNKSGGVDKCECQTCKAVHKYRDPENPVAKPKTSAKSPSKKAVPVEAVWNEAMSNATGSAKKYSMSEKFAEGSIIDHPTFGKGVVQELIGDSKMTVIFETAVKTLICNR